MTYVDHLRNAQEDVYSKNHILNKHYCYYDILIYIIILNYIVSDDCNK
jgi:hypothetical protein